MSNIKRRKQKGRSGSEAHVRLYRHELQSPAWRTLSPNGRALLVEMRALYRPSEGNVVFLSVREAMARLGLSQKPVQAAFADLLERGWIRVHTPGGFSRKTPHATSYRLENEPDIAPGSTASKAYMRWRPDDQKDAA